MRLVRPVRPGKPGKLEKLTLPASASASFFLLFHHLLQSMVAPKRCEYSANGLTAAATVNEAENSHSAMAVSKLSGKVLSHDFFGG